MKRKAEELAASLRRLGPAAAVDMDDAGMRFTLDVVALVRYACLCLQAIRKCLVSPTHGPCRQALAMTFKL